MKRSDLGWGAAAQILNISAGLLILPFILSSLPNKEVGLWFTFIALTGLAQLLELGFQPSIARAVSYAHAGASTLQPQGMSQASAGAGVNHKLLHGIYTVSRRIYARVSFLAALILLGPGALYIQHLTGDLANSRELVYSWMLMATGSTLNFYFGYYNALLHGRGNVTAANITVVASKVCYVVGSVIALHLGAGMLGVAVANLLSVAVGRSLSIWQYRKIASRERGAEKDLQNLLVNKPVQHEIWQALWPNASRLGLTNLGAFMILRGNTLIASTFLGLEAAASYGLTIQLLQALTAVANMPLILQVPKLNRAQVNNNFDQLKVDLGTGIFMGLMTFLLGSSLLMLLGPPLLNLVHSHTTMLPPVETLALTAVAALELHHSFFATYLTTRNEIPFVKSALLSGVAICALSLVSSSMTDLGTAALIASQGLVQLSYNNWKWPTSALTALGTDWFSLIRIGARSSAGVLLGK